MTAKRVGVAIYWLLLNILNNTYMNEDFIIFQCWLSFQIKQGHWKAKNEL